MKKIVSIKLTLDMDHEDKDSWVKKEMFYDTELKEALAKIFWTSKGNFRKHSGKTDSGACTYSMNVAHKK